MSEEIKKPEDPKIPQTDEQKIKELTEYLTTIQFFSNQTKFNSVVYQVLTQILEKLSKIEAKIESQLNSPALPMLPALPEFKNV